MKWIDATDIRNWATRRDCQETLPLLIRKLIRATAGTIKDIKFPAGDSVLIGGWDGILDLISGTEYIPSGRSLWEFGSNSAVKGKADSDYEKRTNNPLGYVPGDSVFVFVTPRLWQAGNKWRKDRLKEGKWKDIKVINAEVLEEWIEIAPTVGIWLAKHLGKYPQDGVVSSDVFWDEWSAGKEFNLPPELLLGGRENEQKKLRESISKPAINAVQAISREEALAFIVATFKGCIESEEDFFARSVIIDNINSFRVISNLVTPLILIPLFDEDNGIINKAKQNSHTIIIPVGLDAEQNWKDTISLRQLDRDSFVKALTSTGLSKEFAERYSKESARNLSILRRQLDFNRTMPAWSSTENIRDIIPALLIGRWDENFQKDRDTIALLANETYENYITKLSKWLNTADLPILKIGSKWRLTSSFDAWSNASKLITKNDFDLLHKCIVDIYNEINPVLELKPDQRQFAGLRGKKRSYSNWIREGVIQSLILTSLLGDKLNLEVRGNSVLWVDNIIFELLESDDPQYWKSLEDKLPLIAEASPKSFLDQILKRIDLENSPIIGLFEEEPGFITPNSYHTGLLWAIECLAWFPEYLAKASIILAKLSTKDPGGKISNRPINSLVEIFKPWHYQTLASFEERMQVLKLLSRKEIQTTWKLLISMLPSPTGSVGEYTHKTRWRMFNIKTENPVTYEEIYATHSSVVDLLISIFDYSESKLSQLIEVSQNLSSPDRNKLLTFIESVINKVDHIDNLSWKKTRHILSWNRSYPDARESLSRDTLERYDELYNKLEPEDEIQKQIWMFNDYPQFPDGIDRKELSIDEQEQIVHDRRLSGVKKIYDQYGLDKIIELSKTIKEKWHFGLIFSEIINEDEIPKLCELLGHEDGDFQFINAFLLKRNDIYGLDEMIKIFTTLEDVGFSSNALSRFLVPLIQSKKLWEFISSKDKDIKKYYWENMYDNFYRISPDEKILGIQNLIENKRFYTAVDVCYHFLDELPAELIISAMQKLATEESTDKRQLRGYEISRIFEHLDEQKDIEEDILPKLEWSFLPILSSLNCSRKPKLLHNEMARDPKFFISVLSWAFLPKNKDLVEEEHKDIPAEIIRSRGQQAYQLIDSWETIPGVSEDGSINKKTLFDWVKEVRKLATEVDRSGICDNQIGKILAQYPEKEETWPPSAICELIESVDSKDLNSGFSSATYNKRSFSSRGPFDGGDIEREKARYFEKLTKTHRNIYPIVSNIFEQLASGYHLEAQRMDERAERDRLDY